MSIISENGALIVKGGQVATKCCCHPYVIASIVLPPASIWDTSPYIGPGIAVEGGDLWRVAEVSNGWQLLAGCVQDDGSLNGMGVEFDNTVAEGIELPIVYGGAFEIQIGCWSESEVIWPE